MMLLVKLGHNLFFYRNIVFRRQRGVWFFNTLLNLDIRVSKALSRFPPVHCRARSSAERAPD